MPSELVRLTLDKVTNNIIVEYGMKHQPGLEEKEWEEKQALEQELMEYQDFTSAEDLDDGERQKLMEKKQRYMELQAKEKAENIEWFPIEAKLIDSILLIFEPDNQPIYVENLPSQFLKKLLDHQITLNIGGSPLPFEGGVLGASHFPASLPPTTNMRKIITLLESVHIAEDVKHWSEVVTIEEEQPGIVYVRPKKFLKEKWGPINIALKEAYGGEVWKSKGKGDRSAHWLINFNR